MISFRCPCGKDIKVKEDLAGRKGKCPGCGQYVLVPGARRDRTIPENDANHRETPEQDATHFLSSAPSNPEVYDFLAPAEKSDELGRLGAYRVLKVLGAGGMGVVFRAEDPGLQRLVALKAMLPTLATSPSAKERFFREARAAAALKHPHIVTIHQVGEDRGAPYLAMEFLEGEPLDERLRKKKRLPVAEILRIGREVAKGLAAAHDKGLIHRDIKPANIWLEGAEAHVKILDFGLARAMADQGHLTQTGAILGTPAYMAPEQASAGVVDHRCDLFSLGCVLYVMCTGELPFKGKDPMSMLMSLALDAPSPPAERNPDVPKKLSDLVMRLLSKKPEERPSSAQAVVQAIQDIEANPGVKKPRPIEKTAKIKAAPATRIAAAPKPSRPPKKPRPWIALVAGGVLGVGVLLAALVVVLWPTPHGTVRIEIDDPNIEVVFDKTGPTIKGIDPTPLTLRAGEHGILIKRGDFEFEADKFQLKSGATVRLTIEVIRGELRLTQDGKVIAAKAMPEPLAKVDPKQPLIEAPKGRSPLDDLKRENIPAYELKTAGLGDPTKTPKELVAILGDSHMRHWAEVWAVAFHPKGHLVASGSNDNLVALWDATTGDAVAFLTGHTGSVLSVSFDRTGKYLASTDWDSTIRIWDVAAGKEHAKLFFGHVKAAVYSPDGRWLMAWSEEAETRKVRFWNAADLTPAGEWQPKDDDVPLSAAFDPQGERVVVGLKSGAVKVYDLKGTEKFATAGHGKGNAVRAVAWSADGKRLASGGNDKMVIVWDAATGAELGRFKEHEKAVQNITFSPDNENVASSDEYGGILYLWKWRNPGKSLCRSIYTVAPAAFDAEGARVACASQNGSLSVCEAQTLKELHQRPGRNETNGYPGQVAFSSDGRKLTLGNTGHPICWDVSTGAGSLRLQTDATTYSCAFSPDGKHAAAGSTYSKKVWLWDAQTGEKLHVFPEFGKSTDRIAFVGEGRWLAAACQTPEIPVYEVTSRKLVQTLKGHKADVTFVAAGRRGNLLASLAYPEGGPAEIKVWDLQGGKAISQFKVDGWAYDLAMNDDGERLIVCGQGRVLVFESRTGRELSRIEVESDFPRAVFGADSKTIYVIGNKSPLQERYVDTGKVLREWPKAVPNEWTSLALAPDGRHLAVVRGNMTVWILRLAPPVGEPVAGRGPLDDLKREDIPAVELKNIGLGDPTKTPKELVAVLGDSRFLHWHSVADLAYSPDSKSIASIGNDCAIRVWDAATGEQRFACNCPQGVIAVAWSRNGKWLASGHYGTTRLWDAQTGMELAELEGRHKHWVTQLAFSPDDKWLASASEDGTVGLWEADTGKHVATFEGHVKPVRCVAFSPDSKRVASGGVDNRVLVWNVSDRNVVHTLDKHTKAVRSVAFRHDGKQIASGSDDATARVWDAQTGAEVCVLDGHKDWVGGVAFQPDTGRLAVREQDGVDVWDVENKKKLHFENTWQNPHHYAGRIAYSPDGKRLTAVGFQGLWTWDVAAAKVLSDPAWRAMAVHVSFRPDGKRLALGGGTNGIFDLLSRRKAEKPEADLPGTPVYGADGKTLALVVSTGIWVHETDGSRLRHQLETKFTPGRHAVLTINRDGTLLASGSHEKTVILWDLASGKKRHTLTGHKHPVLTAAFSPDGRRLVTGGGDVFYYGNDGSTQGEVKVWDTATGKEALRLDGHAAPGDVWSVAWSGDGKRIASASADKTVKLWDADTGKVARTFAENKSALRCVLFRHDARTMLSVDGDGVLLEWDGASGKVLRRWQFPGTISHLDLAADGRHLATANFNGTAYILRLEPGPVAQMAK